MGALPTSCSGRRSLHRSGRGGGSLDIGSASTWVLPAVTTAARLARRRVEESCAGLPSEKVDVVRLLATELVANALQHGSGAVVLHVRRDDPAVEVAVEDENPRPPQVVHPETLQEHGAGMRLVNAMADRWGVTARSDAQPGKRVWFCLD